MNRFKDRHSAGQLLARALQSYARDPHAIVIGLPRGGVVTAYEVTKALDLPLDVIVPRKLGAPGQPELAVGAVTEDASVLFNNDIMIRLGLKPQDLDHIVDAQIKEAQRRIALFRKDRPPLDLHGKTAIIVDDGVATGATMRAAIKSACAKGAERIILALPVAPIRFRDSIQDAVDEIIILQEPEFFPAVGYFYEQFAQTEDDEVVRLLEQSR